MLPYISCMMAATGMMIHFMLILIKFMKGFFNRETAPVGFKIWQLAVSTVLILGLTAVLQRSTKAKPVDESKNLISKAALQYLWFIKDVQNR